MDRVYGHIIMVDEAGDCLRILEALFALWFMSLKQIFASHVLSGLNEGETSDNMGVGLWVCMGEFVRYGFGYNELCIMDGHMSCLVFV